ncbi:ATP-dependent helicase [Microbacterium amylolyticum]|uniref:DNA 3'-5' helicase n=1 Tax=Microbacterium amylolyticum TaxID=936337 RepID=A0ABS4ZKG2_9MICO|nr:ATP-dependent helicase [Microbacterium amylolyticum]MBP2437780.1 DNA helicase-2/ATP-dependent DNA helicase PcrA [Microbacterium amylolyticum]
MSVLDALDSRQREAAETLRGPVAVLAGAGTGKTRVITHRIAHGVETGAYTPSRVLALTFTAKAAGELRGRLRQLGVPGVPARTFHAAALAQLNFFWPTVAGDTAPAIVDNKVRLLAHAADTVRLSPDKNTLRDIASQIEWRKVTMRSIPEYAALGRTVGRVSTDQLVDLMTAYETLKDERRQLDFEDVLLACAGMIESEPRVAVAIREQYRHFTVDEYQDVSALQNRLLELWLGKRSDICVVGDASQTIYSFAGAEARYLLEFGSRYSDATVVRLERNYRSVPAVLDVANALMRDRPGALRLESAMSSSPALRPTVSEHADESSEASCVAAQIRSLVNGDGGDPVPASDIAVLYRSHAQSALLQGALSAEGIPTTVLGGKRFFDMPEVRQAIMSIRAAAVSPTDLSFADAVRDILRGLGHTDDAPEAGGALREAWEARSALLRLAEEAPGGATMRGFADSLLARAQDQHEPELRTVTLATLHSAKGLEWPHVFMIGVSEGLLPISYATTLEGIDEERRLAYVGITRAAQSLRVSWSRGGGRSARSPSRFLREIGTDTLPPAGAIATGASRRR